MTAREPKVFCATCRFAVRHDKDGYGCYRYPPVPVVTYMPQDKVVGYENLRPFVTAQDWCGEGREA